MPAANPASGGNRVGATPWGGGKNKWKTKVKGRYTTGGASDPGNTPPPHVENGTKGTFTPFSSSRESKEKGNRVWGEVLVIKSFLSRRKIAGLGYEAQKGAVTAGE